MNEELKRIGDMLRSKRKELNMTHKEIENATSIRSTYLEAIEEGKINQCIASIYVFGFTKQYAVFLGFDFDRMLREHPTAFNLSPEKHEFSYGIGTLEMRGSHGGGVKWLPNLMWASAFILVLVLAWYFAKAMNIL